MDDHGEMVVIFLVSGEMLTPIRTVSEKTYVKIEYINKNTAKIYSRMLQLPHQDLYEVTSVAFEIAHHEHVIKAVNRWESKRL
jgi:putative NADH-flavin reductase